MSFAGTPVRDALDSALVALRAAGLDTPRLDAELLLAHALGVDRTALVLHPELPVEGAAARTFRDHVRRRSVAREPVAYLVGTRGFRRLDVAVDPRVLIPRPETEHLVEAALGLPPGARVLDVGTGSGAVALALKDERGDLEVTGADVSEDALAVARANAAALGLDVAWRSADLLDGLGPEWDAIVSNPPYVEDGASLAREIGHEPPGALFAGADGLDVIRRLVPQAAATRAAFLALEVGAGQAADVAELVRAAGFPRTRTVPDLAGIPRIVVGER